jgi:hypothetical protein
MSALLSQAMVIGLLGCWHLHCCSYSDRLLLLLAELPADFPLIMQNYSANAVVE